MRRNTKGVMVAPRLHPTKVMELAVVRAALGKRSESLLNRAEIIMVVKKLQIEAPRAMTGKLAAITIVHNPTPVKIMDRGINRCFNF